MTDDRQRYIRLGLGTASMAAGFLAVRYLHKQMPVLRLRHKIRAKWTENGAFHPIKVNARMHLELDKYEPMKFYFRIRAEEARAHKKANAGLDPFIEENSRSMFIAQLSPTHNLIFNKFWISPYHVLIVTKDFVAQHTPLTQTDFTEALKVMKALDGFAFFNSGPKAGASQNHKHIQAIPYNSYPDRKIPIDALIDDHAGKYFSLPYFKFKHTFYGFTERDMKQFARSNFEEAAGNLREVYQTCLKKLGNEDLSTEYNLILTNRWAFVVLRKSEFAESNIKINAMGFTGSFVVNQDEAIQLLKQDPFSVLAQVSQPL
eukprot:TRINITY_DN6390_c0_g3_i1.p1 TRINITY_DN6390_c0_g3~~TRINITY_DN6390_c0_g3_i1.p1  ORF type:complete len:317 (-),score=50.60 TRINITY_DN6390_c0_g3_i1:588-1538(-)